MNQDVTYMVALCDLERRMREHDRRAFHLSELRDWERRPGLLRRAVAAMTGLFRSTGAIEPTEPPTRRKPQLEIVSLRDA